VDVAGETAVLKAIGRLRKTLSRPAASHFRIKIEQPDR